MKITTINLQDGEGLSRLLGRQRITPERFSLEVPLTEACNLLWQAVRSVAAERGESVELDIPTRDHIGEVAAWLINPTGKPGLLFYGLTGNGKTTLARALQKAIVRVTEEELGYDKRMRAHFITGKEAVGMSIAKELSKDFAALRDSRLLILDDLGEEPVEVIAWGQPWTPVVDLLEHRYDRRLMTIATSNLNSEQLKKKYGMRLYDRFRAMFEPVVFANPSYRK